MRHIKIYEAFQDEVPASMRDLFGLTTKFVIWNEREWRYVMEGPTEYEEEARQLGNVIREFIDKQIDLWKKKEAERDPSFSSDEYIDDFEYVDDFIENGMPEEQQALANIGWEIRFEYNEGLD